MLCIAPQDEAVDLVPGMCNWRTCSRITVRGVDGGQRCNRTDETDHGGMIIFLETRQLDRYFLKVKNLSMSSG